MSTIRDIQDIKQTKQMIVALQQGMARHVQRHNDHLLRFQNTLTGLKATLAKHPDQDLVARVDVPGYHPSR